MKANYDVIIIGGSYAGLSAAMSLGRALKDILIIDSGKPCNRQTPNAHNLITHDGDTPASIKEHALQQMLRYPTVTLKNGLAIKASKQKDLFTIQTESGETYAAKKLLFATGIVDIMPDIPGFADCWGITVVHCPYCHGYEIHSWPTGIIANGDAAFEYARLINNWTKDLTLFTNGMPQLSEEQFQKLQEHQITINDKLISSLNHNNGILKHVEFADGSIQNVKAIYSRPSIKQHSDLPELLGCELTDMGFIKVDGFQATTIDGVFAAGDNATMFRSLAIAIADGNKAGAVIDKQLIQERF